MTEELTSLVDIVKADVQSLEQKDRVYKCLDLIDATMKEQHGIITHYEDLVKKLENQLVQC